MPNGDQIDYIIDGQNRRIGLKVDGVITNRWIYAGQLHPIGEVDSVGNIIASYYGSYIKKGDTIYRTIRDHLGSVRLVVNAQTGELAQRIEYDEYGNVLSNTNPDFQPFAYVGGLYDTQTKLVRFGARDYDAITGRWTNKDPILFDGDDANLYAYVWNSPIDWSDPSGLKLKIKNDKKGKLQEKYNKVKKDKFGKKVCTVIEESPTEYTMEPTDDPRGSYFDPNNNTFYINPDYYPLVETTEGKQPAPIDVQMVHEMGHGRGASQYGSEVFDIYENPYRESTGRPQRLR